MSIALICLGGLGLSFVVTLQGIFISKTSSRPAIPKTSLMTATNSVLSGDAVIEKANFTSTAGDATFERTNLLRQIRAALNSGNPAEEASVFSVYFPRLIKTDPWAAARFAESPEVGDSRTELMRVLALSWAQTDFASATNWIAQVVDPNERDTMLGCICFKISETDAALAVQILAEQGLNERRNVILGSLVQQWTSQDLQGAIDWADNYPVGRMRDDLFSHIALAECETAPVESARLVAQQISPGPVQDEAVIQILQRWARLDLSAAVTWAEQFPSSRLRDRAAETVSRLVNFHGEDMLSEPQIQR
jgi:hypothetical protein